MKFKFITHKSHDAYFNMAFDEWMLDKVIADPSLVILRLYSWSPGAISFGLNQRIDKAFDHNQTGKTPIIRRATGGRAIFHDQSELTYGLAVGSEVLESKKFGGSVSDSSLAISTILVNVLKDYGIDSSLVRQSIGEEKSQDFFHSAPCFESVAKYEIVTEQQKIIASAQRRVAGSVLQHGSIKINGFKSHPALPLKETNILNHNEIEVASDTQFQRFGELMKIAFERVLGAVFKQLCLSELDKNDLYNKINFVKNNSLEKRNPIKQK